MRDVGRVFFMSSWMQKHRTRPILAIAQIAREVGQRDYSRRGCEDE